MVKIDITKNIPKATLHRIKRSGSTDSSNFNASVGEQSNAEGSIQVNPLLPNNSLLSLQEINEDAVAQQHGNKVLDLLEKYRLTLIQGKVEDQVLLELIEYVKGQEITTKDPLIRDVLSEIELRAKVELAKRDLI